MVVISLNSTLCKELFGLVRYLFLDINVKIAILILNIFYV